MEFFRYIRWVWSRWETWQKFFMVGAFLVGAGLGAPDPYSIWLLGTGCTLIYGWAVKWMVWDNAKKSWKKYCDERDNLFSVIRGDK